MVWRHAELSEAQFRELWLGEHVKWAKQLKGLRQYVIGFVTDGPAGAPAGIATLCFDSRAAADAAFADADLSRELLRTRESFASSVQVMFVDEVVVVPLEETPNE